jgi:hypothetical protein
LQTIGSIGDYAVSAVSTDNPTYYKRGGPTAAQTTVTALSNLYNTWVLVGSDDWKTSWPTVQGTNSVSTALTNGNNMFINGQLVTVGAGGTALTVAGLATAINNLSASIPGVYAASISNKLTIYADSTASNDGSTADGGVVSIQAGPNGGTGLLTALGITATEYYAPNYLPGYSYQQPRWSSTQTQPAPTGSVWQNISSAGNGMSLKVKTYSAALDVWVPQVSNVYANDAAANYTLDPTGGGRNIPVGTTYVQYDVLQLC